MRSSETARLSFLVAAAWLVVLASPADALTVQVTGSYVVSYTPIAGNAPTFTYGGALNHTSFTKNLVLDGPATSPQNFFVINPASSCGSTCVKGPNEGTALHPHYYYTASGTVSVTFAFSNLTVVPATSTLTETGLYEAKYGGLPLTPCALPSGPGDTDCITWKTNAQGGHNPLVVNFTNGETLDIFLYDAEDWAITPKISFQLLTTQTTPQCTTGAGCEQVPGTPIPGALPLFATGLGALGLLGWRRKRKAQAAA